MFSDGRVERRGIAAAQIHEQAIAQLGAEDTLMRLKIYLQTRVRNSTRPALTFRAGMIRPASAGHPLNKQLWKSAQEGEAYEDA